MSNVIAQCPHCGRHLRTCVIAQHVGVCPANPAIVARLRTELDDGGYIVSSALYNSTPHPGLPSAGALLAHYGSWRGVAAVLGLRPRDGAMRAERADATRAQYVRVQQTRALYASLGLYESGTALVDTTGCERVAADYTFDGLPVATDAHGAPIVRPVHGGGVAYMVR